MGIREEIMELSEAGNADFQAKLTPGIQREKFLGVRVPKLRELEKKYRGSAEASAFISELPHDYYDENMLHSVFICNMKDYGAALAAVEAFLTFVDNWAVCDTMRPVAFKKNKDDLIVKIKEWIASPECYTCRFGIDMLMTYYLDGDFNPAYLELPAAVHSQEYYINMMIAWYYATALAKQWDDTIPYIENGRLDTWVHNKTIQKAVESYRISDERKSYLKGLRRK